MGLAVSQVRLLALTNRKADIELQMQVNSKRKMMLTRKSTELAQLYYSKLQNSHIQYATSAGYEDVTYGYLMGDTNMDGDYTATFLQQLAVGASDLVKKPESNMILTNQFGEVVVNNTLARIIQETNDNYKDATTVKKSCYAILSLVEQYCDKIPAGVTDPSKFAMKFLFDNQLSNEFHEVDEGKKEQLAANMEVVFENGGYKGQRTVYVADGHGLDPGNDKDHPGKNLDVNKLNALTYYASAEDARAGKNPIDLEPGMCYEIRSAGYNNGTTTQYILSEPRYYGKSTATATTYGFAPGLSLSEVKYLSNLMNYFAPILSSAFQNGTTTKAYGLCTGTEGVREYRDDGKYSINFGGGNILKSTNGIDTKYFDPTQSKDDIDIYLQGLIRNADGNSNTYGLPQETSYMALDTADGIAYYRINYNSSTKRYSIEDIYASEYYTKYNIVEGTDSEERKAMNNEQLQAGFRSGTFQLAMVSSTKHGIYHKNTTMNYFTHMNYVVEKTDSSEREEITAWFNAEQAEISNQETYWDTEIQNLSAELSSVNTEISSVKQLKSDNIKSVFNWGGS